MLGIFVVMQMIPYHIKNDETDPKHDFFAMNQAPANVQALVKASCYDCHSHQARNPWYGRVAPIKYWINRHVRGGRINLDFSNWHQYDAGAARHKLEECADEIGSHEMPLNSYLWMHPEAKLSADDRALLVDYFKDLSAKK